MDRPADSSCSSVSVADDFLANDPEELQRMQLALAEMERRLQGLQVKREQIAQMNADLDDIDKEFAEKKKKMHSRLDELEKMIPKANQQMSKKQKQRMQKLLEMKLPTPSVSCENSALKERGGLEENLADLTCAGCKEKNVSPMGAKKPASIRDPTPKTGIAPGAFGMESIMERLDEIAKRTEEFSNDSRNHSTSSMDNLVPKHPMRERHDRNCVCCGGHF